MLHPLWQFTLSQPLQGRLGLGRKVSVAQPGHRQREGTDVQGLAVLRDRDPLELAPEPDLDFSLGRVRRPRVGLLDLGPIGQPLHVLEQEIAGTGHGSETG